MKAVDDALGSAAEVKKKPSKDVDKKFARAIEVLSHYEEHHHPRHANAKTASVSERMVAAKDKDKSTSTVLNVLKEMLCQKVRLAHIIPHHTNTITQAADDKQSEPTTVVEFLLFKSLPDKNPTIVRREH